MPSERHPPGISDLLVASALDPELRQRLLDAPDEVFGQFDLSDEEKELLRHPDHRLLPLLGAALAHNRSAAVEAPKALLELPPEPVAQGSTLPDMSLVLTVVPCAQYAGDALQSFSYAVWVSPLPQGVDPASLPVPEGATIPGRALAPLHAVIQISALQMQDAAGNPQVGLSASFRQSTNIAVPPSESDPQSPQVQAAVAAVRAASSEERYGRLIDLVHALRPGGAQ
jgi:hypothetical protein